MSSTNTNRNNILVKQHEGDFLEVDLNTHKNEVLLLRSEEIFTSSMPAPSSDRTFGKWCSWHFLMHCLVLIVVPSTQCLTNYHRRPSTVDNHADQGNVMVNSKCFTNPTALLS